MVTRSAIYNYFALSHFRLMSNRPMSIRSNPCQFAPTVTWSVMYILPFPIFVPCQIARFQVALIVTLSAISPGVAEKLTQSREPERFLPRDFSSVSSRWYRCARESPCALHPVSGKFPHLRDDLRCKDEERSCIVSQTNTGSVSEANLNL